MGEARRALLSVSDKAGLAEFATGLRDLGFELVATEGTATFLRGQGLVVKDLAEVTGMGPILGGRLKTLHPRIHAGILAVSTNADHVKDLDAIGASPFSLVVVNLYPFREMVAKGVPPEEVIEQIDIGGVALLRSAAKNSEHVAVVSSPIQYASVIAELQAGNLTLHTHDRLALEAFALTSAYDTAITNWFAQRIGHPLPPALRLAYDKVQDLRYGENPFQKAAFYADPEERGLSLANCDQLHGKALSFNNLLDFHAALELALEFQEPVAVIVKHGNPSGVAIRDSPAEAYSAAHASDPKAAYGCVVGFNRTVDSDVGRAMKGHFIEGIIAPDFAPMAVNRFKNRVGIRLLRPRGMWETKPGWHLIQIRGGMLVQTTVAPEVRGPKLKVVTRVKPTDEHIRDLLFATKVCKYAKSNAVVLARDMATVAIGAGQVSRVDAVSLAAMKAGAAARGSVLSSDAFFPFRDGIDEAAKAGVSAILQPGGSIRDQEVVDAADGHRIPMVFSGVRFFKH